MAVDSYATPLLVSSILMIIVATSSVAMRLYVRTGILGGLGWDDALITASWVFAMGLYSATLAARNYGFGQHMAIVPSEDISTFSRLIMVCSTTYSWGVPAAKASFAVLYLRILQGRRLAMLNKFLIVFLVCQAIEETLVVVLQCRPISKAWDTTVEGHCIRLVPMWWCTFVFNLFTDLTLFIQPIPTMWHLQLPLTKRVGVIAMLSLGLLVCVISVIRIVYVTKIGADSTFELAEPMIWSQVEITALILCSCIPSLRQVIQKIPWLNRLVGLSSAKDSANNQYYASGTGGRGVRSGTKGAGTGARGVSIALYSRSGGHDDPFGPVRSHTKSQSGNPFGMVSRAERDRDGGRPPSQDGSTDEIFPSYHRHQGGSTPMAGGGGTAGAILVTRELNIKHDDSSVGDLSRSHGGDGRNVFSDLDLGDSTGQNMAKASTSSTSSSTSLTDGVATSPKRAK
ncbi:hypothetical protein SEUCBS140593_000906 [Sporothrix eucalyptigena]|uniref:Rhodopsin domain-containing protein n=1 Tax=Sporothrix eucalyptigena TaxID=1812306 RepID=A0ABP0ATS6_9PEZI